MSLANKAAKGMVWTTISTVVKSIVGLVQISILTRHLEMDAFGTVAIATVFIGFTQIFRDMGISSGIMHKQDTTRDQFSSLFWLNILTGIVLSLVLIACAPLVALSYNDDTLTPVIMLLSLTVLFGALGSQHSTMQQKNMRFKYIAVVEIISAIFALIVAVVMAINGYGIYSLVYSTLTGTAVANLLFLVLGLIKDKNIDFHFNLRETYPYLKIGAFSIGAKVLDYFSREIDIMFIGASYGAQVLGLYTLCKKIVQMLYGIINPVITKILTPMFATLQTDKTRVISVYYKLIETLSITNLPVYFLVAVFSQTILYYLYGADYVQGAFILSILSIYYGILSLGNPVGSLQIAFGRTDLGFYWTIYRLITTFIILYIASFYNIETLVLLFLILSVINTIAMWRFQIFTMVQMPFVSYFTAMWKPLIGIVIICIPFYLLFWTKTSLPYAIGSSVIVLILYFIYIQKFLSTSYIVGLVNVTISPYLNKRKI